MKRLWVATSILVLLFFGLVACGGSVSVPDMGQILTAAEETVSAGGYHWAEDPVKVAYWWARSQGKMCGFYKVSGSDGEATFDVALKDGSGYRLTLTASGSVWGIKSIQKVDASCGGDFDEFLARVPMLSFEPVGLPKDAVYTDAAGGRFYGVRVEPGIISAVEVSGGKEKVLTYAENVAHGRVKVLGDKVYFMTSAGLQVSPDFAFAIKDEIVDVAKTSISIIAAGRGAGKPGVIYDARTGEKLMDGDYSHHISGLWVLPTDERVVFSLSDMGVHVSYDGGKSWQALSGVGAGFAMADDLWNPGGAFIGGSNIIYRWSPAGVGVIDVAGVPSAMMSDVRDGVVLVITHDGSIYLLKNNEIYRWGKLGVSGSFSLVKDGSRLLLLTGEPGLVFEVKSQR